MGNGNLPHFGLVLHLSSCVLCSILLPDALSVNYCLLVYAHVVIIVCNCAAALVNKGNVLYQRGDIEKARETGILPRSTTK